MMTTLQERHRSRISPQPPLRLLRLRLQFLQRLIPQRVLFEAPREAGLDELVIQQALSGRNTSATVHPWRSLPIGTTVTVLWKASSDVKGFAAVPKGWPPSGQSMPYRRTFSPRPVSC